MPLHLNLLTPKEQVNFDAISIGIASPDDILSWSYGEVLKPETINYRTQRPERDGLFCEKIFGPTKNWECYCGKYKKIKYKGIICERCGVEVTNSMVRRERMGHIKLAAPVAHTWFLRSVPSRLGLLLDVPSKKLEQVCAFASYIVKSVDEKGKQKELDKLYNDFKKKELVYKKEYNILKQTIQNKKLKSSDEKNEIENLDKEFAQKIDALKETFEQMKYMLENLSVCTIYNEVEYVKMREYFGHIFDAGIGAQAVLDVINQIDLKKIYQSLEEELKKISAQQQPKIIKRMKLIGDLIRSNTNPANIILTVLPVLPPDLRPMVPIDGGRYATSDLNDLYRRVINRNNRLKKLIELGAPDIITKNEKRMLQEAVDALINNSGRGGKAIFAANKRKYKSISDFLKGKQGRFRQNLLGKRVDYSGRSVIVVNPKLKLYECGLPKKMALELFKPFILGKLIRDGFAYNIKKAERMIEHDKKEVWDVLDEIISDAYVLLNRAPTLHRLGIQAFKPILTEGKAIQIHPFICKGFNADFDGDQMAVHVPLSKKAIQEARTIMLSKNNLLSPGTGEPIVLPDQEVVLGIYFLTMMDEEKIKEYNEKLKNIKVKVSDSSLLYPFFTSMHECLLALDEGKITLHEPIRIKILGEVILTTPGRVVFNSVLPIQKIGYQNELQTKDVVQRLVSKLIEYYGTAKTDKFLDNLKEIGNKYATMSGISISIQSMMIPPERESILNESEKKISKINKLYRNGFITKEEKRKHTILVWLDTKSIIDKVLKDLYLKNKKDELFIALDSKARGNWGQMSQMLSMKGTMVRPSGELIELPVKSNYKKGLSILEYFISNHGGRKGDADTAIKTASAGYLTRKLVDATQEIICREVDCKTKKFDVITRDYCKKQNIPFFKRIYSYVSAEQIIDPNTKTVLCDIGKEIDLKIAKMIDEAGINEVKIRSPLMCESINSICQKCYGIDIAIGETVKIGNPIGIIAAQSIGEPGTQLTMKLFHSGGVSSGKKDITSGLDRVTELFEARTPKSKAIISDISGKVYVKNNEDGDFVVTIHSNDLIEEKYKIPYDYNIMVKEGDKLDKDAILAAKKGTRNIIKAKTNCVVQKVLKNSIIVKNTDVVIKQYIVNRNDLLNVKDGDLIDIGHPINDNYICPKELFELTDDVYKVKKYIISEVNKEYISQGLTIHEKHFEVVVRQIFSKVKILDAGNSNYLPGKIVNIYQVEKDNVELIKSGKKPIVYERLLLGLTRVALSTESWLAAASFQETIRVLIESAITGAIDKLYGLKENVIIGRLLPIGERYHRMYNVSN